MLIFYNETSAYIVFFMLYFVNIICTLPSELSFKNRFLSNHLLCFRNLLWLFIVHRIRFMPLTLTCTAHNNVFSLVFCFFFKKPLELMEHLFPASIHGSRCLRTAYCSWCVCRVLLLLLPFTLIEISFKKCIKMC